MLIQQDGSPFRLGSTFWFSWRLVIQDFFGARHVAKLSDWRIGWQAGNSGQQKLTSAVRCADQTISAFFYNSREGPIRILETVPPDRSHYGNGDMYAPKGPRAHTMSPPLLD
jgi:hypothetical protein